MKPAICSQGNNANDMMPRPVYIRMFPRYKGFRRCAKGPLTIRYVPPTFPVVLVSLPAQLTPQSLIDSPIMVIRNPMMRLQIFGYAKISITTTNGIGV